MGFEQHDREENVNIDYNTLILNQLNRIGNNASMMLGEIVSGQGYVVKTQENDRLISFIWGVRTLEMFVPDSLHDTQYLEDLETYKEFQEQKFQEELLKLDEEAQEKAKKNLKLYRLSLIDRADLNRKKLKLIVNLLARRGFLFDLHQSVILPKREEMMNE